MPVGVPGVPPGGFGGPPGGTSAPPGRSSAWIAAPVAPPGGSVTPAGAPGTWPGGAVTSASPNENADYYASTQTHLPPAPSWPAAGTAPPGGGAAPGWAPGGWPPQAGPMGPMPPVGGPMGPIGPTGPFGPAPGRHRRSGNRGKVALIAGGVVVIAAASAGIALALSSSSPSGSSVAAAPTHKPLHLTIPSVKASPAASKSPVAVTTSPAARQTTIAPAEPAVDGVWSGTYTCNQGLTGMKMTITGSSDNNLQATVDFYAVSSNPDVPNGSYVMTGDYSSSGGLVLTPDHWIDQPPGYQMVGFSSPGPSGGSMQGTVQYDGCTAFSVSK